MIRRSTLCALAVLLVFQMGSLWVHGQSRVLIYTKNGEGHVHKNITACVRALEDIMEARGIDAEVANDPSIFTDAGLAPFAAVVFANTNNETVDTAEQKAAFQRYIRNGGGFVGIHSACGSERDWPWYWALLGGSFAYHAPMQAFTVRVMDKEHISTAAYPEATWSWKDEFYILKHVAEGRHVLLAGEIESLANKGHHAAALAKEPNPYPLAWCHEFEGGRSWYTALGHKPEHYDNPLFRQHLRGGILWAIGTGTGTDASPGGSDENP